MILFMLQFIYWVAQSYLGLMVLDLMLCHCKSWCGTVKASVVTQKVA